VAALGKALRLMAITELQTLEAVVVEQGQETLQIGKTM